MTEPDKEEQKVSVEEWRRRALAAQVHADRRRLYSPPALVGRAILCVVVFVVAFVVMFALVSWAA